MVTERSEDVYWQDYYPSPHLPTPQIRSGTCVPTALHECQCDNTYEIFDLIIDGDSVKVGPKLFKKEEILRLKTLNGANNETTYSIF